MEGGSWIFSEAGVYRVRVWLRGADGCEMRMG